MRILSLVCLVLVSCKTVPQSVEHPRPQDFKFTEVEKKDPVALLQAARGRLRSRSAPVASVQKVSVDFIADEKAWNDGLLHFTLKSGERVLASIEIVGARAGQLPQGETRFEVKVAGSEPPLGEANQATLHFDGATNFEIEEFDLFINGSRYHYCPKDHHDE